MALRFLAVGCFLLFGASVRAQSDVAPLEPMLEFDALQTKMALEFGQLVRGEFRTSGTFATPIENLGLNRNVVFLRQSATLDRSWKFDAGLMGVLWWPFSPVVGPPGSRSLRVEPRLSILSLEKRFGNTSSESHATSARTSNGFTLQVGYFPYQTNPDAVNLGEYLYRSGTYPGFITTTDGYQLMGHSAYDAYGVHANWVQLQGWVTHHFNFFMETVTDPIGDITPAYEIAIHHPRFQLGAGMAYNRGLTFHPSLSTPKDDLNSYIEVLEDATQNRAYYKGPFKGAPVSIQGDTTRPFRVLHRWTHRGLKLMGRAALDLNFLLPAMSCSPEDLRLFVEVAVLGWQNQPYFYEDRTERMPIMFGLNLPTFKALDKLAFQMEYYNARFNDTYYYNIGSLPIWKVQNYQTQDLGSYRNNPWRWSLHGKRQVNSILSIQGQIASDHLRLREFTTAATEYELILYPKNWYYLVRMEIGI